jgi:hypothetical protein
VRVARHAHHARVPRGRAGRAQRVQQQRREQEVREVVERERGLEAVGGGLPAVDSAPALLTSTSRRGARARTSAASRRTSAWRDRSASSTSAEPPRPPPRARSAASRPRVLAPPGVARHQQHARAALGERERRGAADPVVAPVTSAVRPVSVRAVTR